MCCPVDLDHPPRHRFGPSTCRFQLSVVFCIHIGSENGTPEDAKIRLYLKENKGSTGSNNLPLKSTHPCTRSLKKRMMSIHSPPPQSRGGWEGWVAIIS